MNGIQAPGTLRGYAIDSNPNGAGGSQLFVLKGVATKGPIHSIQWDSGAAFPSPRNCIPPRAFLLQIYHFNDLHGYLLHKKPGKGGAVFSRIAGRVQTTRKEIQDKPDTAVLVLAAGDDCTGSILDETMGGEGNAYPFHAAYHLYSQIGVDAAALGNHDLDHGLPFLAESIRKDARFPILAANLSGCQELSGTCHPAAILVVKGIRIGLIGLVTRAETHLDLSRCQIADPITTAKNLIPAIRPLCDAVIILSHLGYSLEKSNVPMADAGDVELAQSMAHREVDLIIGGHSHSAINMDGLQPDHVVNDIPIVQAGAMGEFLGQVDIQILGERASVVDARLISTESLPMDRDFEKREIQPLRWQINKLLQRDLGKIEADPELSTEYIKKCFARGELALANFVTDALVTRLAKRGLSVDLAMIDSSALLCGLPADETLTFGDWFEIMPYADTVRLYAISPEQLEVLLQDNALRMDRPGEDHLERGFLHFSHQLRYCVDLGENWQNATARDITLNGVPLRNYKKEILNLATTSFIRQSALTWESGLDTQQVKGLVNLDAFHYTETDIFLRKEMISHILQQGGVTQDSGARQDGRLRVHVPEI